MFVLEVVGIKDSLLGWICWFFFILFKKKEGEGKGREEGVGGCVGIGHS